MVSWSVLRNGRIGDDVHLCIGFEVVGLYCHDLTSTK